MFDPAPNLPDDTLIEMVRFSPLIRKSLNAAGLKTIGEIRAMPDDKLQSEAFALAKSLAEGPTVALQFMKDNLDEALDIDFDTALDHEAERLTRAAQTADHKEAVRAFIEKRKPVFKGN